ncbi:HepT-like ribonuclease domain-containing protein [Tessaracoccus caeni]|uniref:HepT-like ribonuclease domain-containing protein n=1 Tax=Tessaracoccus caeni TaxID=3031239 RepID=UPI0023DA4226|nr:HepT-like ribonuclease domain-containing protein [Tessaracoccus caeni]MDF1487096.1 DUF86 domain-containing protein [Tessaracoccus caeni]
MSATETQRIMVALEHLNVLHRHLAAGSFNDEVVTDAVSMRLSAAIAAIHDGDPALGIRLFKDEWQDIWGMRNRIAHGYMTTDPEIIIDSVNNDLPDFEQTLRAELNRLTSDSSATS